jgi:transcriptional regulator of acetoin/glycerol metabolism
MLRTDTLSMARANAVRARGNALPPEGLPPGQILDSWVRCMGSRLDPNAPMEVPVVGAGDLAQRRERAAFVRRLAQAELETLAPQIAGSNFLLAFADHEGVILDLYADNRFVMSGSGAGIVAGSRWDEAVAGTNGLGTALAAGRSVAVTGLEHFFFSLGDISCTATPVRDAAGDVVGVLDASSYFESRQQHTQALVQMAATHIENGLLLHQTPRYTVLAVHPRAEFLGTLSAGLMAFDDEGRLRALNARAAHLLSGLAATRGASYEDLFGEPFDKLLARLHVGHEVRLRDVLGSSLVAHVMRRPAPQRAASGLLRSTDTWVASGTTPPASPVAVRGDMAHARRHARPVDAAVAASRALPADIIAADPVVAEAFRLVEAAVRMNAPILIEGETGSGKELLARHAHDCSGRRGEFVAVNCAVLPSELFEAELFGHAGGASIGSRRDGSIGLIASADGGTLLLDEVRDLPLPLQAALLRFLDDRLVRPVGGTLARRVDVQLLAATNVALEEEVAACRFRADLLYRLSVIKAVLPPLRCRSDMAEAVHGVLATIEPRATLGDGALERLARHGWPGNFRELRAVLTRALLARRLRGDAAVIGVDDLDAVLPGTGAAAGLGLRGGYGSALRVGDGSALRDVQGSASGDEPGSALRDRPGSALPGTPDLALPGTPGSALRNRPGSALQAEATERVCREFERCGRSVSRTSRSLGISRTTVYRHLREGGVVPQR